MSKKRVPSYDDTLFASNGSPARTPFGFAQGKLTREPDYLS